MLVLARTRLDLFHRVLTILLVCVANQEIPTVVRPGSEVNVQPRGPEPSAPCAQKREDMFVPTQRPAQFAKKCARRFTRALEYVGAHTNEV